MQSAFYKVPWFMGNHFLKGPVSNNKAARRALKEAWAQRSVEWPYMNWKLQQWLHWEPIEKSLTAFFIVPTCMYISFIATYHYVEHLNCLECLDIVVLLSLCSNRYIFISYQLHSKKKKYFQTTFLVLQLVTNKGLVSVLGRTNLYFEGPHQEYIGVHVVL